MHASSPAAAVVLLAAASFAQAFEQKVSNPDFLVSVPGLPAIAMSAEPVGDAGGSRTLNGADDRHKVALTVTRAGREVNANACAATFVRQLVKRPGMPDKDGIYRAPLDNSTFLVLYVLSEGTGRLLHAHLLSAVAATHCIDAHFTKALRSGEDEDAWRESFVGARVRDLGR